MIPFYPSSAIVSANILVISEERRTNTDCFDQKEKLGINNYNNSNEYGEMQFDRSILCRKIAH